jgi:ABC-type lipoprotein export system ATPase subunit
MIITMNTITKKFEQSCNGPLTVLDSISQIFTPTTTYGIAGVSGSGKSTLLNILTGFLAPNHGQVLYDTTNIHELSIKAKEHFLSSTIGIMFQKPHLLYELSIIENVILKGLIIDMPHDQAIKKGLELLDAIGLGDKAYEYPIKLSGGQQQRIALIRALYNKPVWLFIDEPTAHLDAECSQQLLALCLHWCKEHHIGLIINSHDPMVLQQLDTVLVLHNGRLQEQKEAL